MATPSSGEVIPEEEQPAVSDRVTIQRPTYDELQFEESFHPLGYQRFKVHHYLSGISQLNALFHTIDSNGMSLCTYQHNYRHGLRVGLVGA